MEYSVVIPLFNEEQSLGILQESLSQVMESLSCQYEIIYVNDGSKDNSLDILRGIKEKCAKVNIAALKENKGQSAALQAGFKIARGRWIITLDADNQNPPGEIPKLVTYKNGFDFITGVRRQRKDNLFRKGASLAARLFRWIVLGDDTQDTGCSLRLFKREIIEAIPAFKNFHRFFTFLVKAKGFLVKEVCVQHNKRQFGKSKYGVLKRAWEGFFDLWGVFWLKNRLLIYEMERD